MNAVRGAVLIVAAIMMAAAARGDDAPPPGPPLANEDVVRMVASGTPEAEIVDAVRTRPANFDVSDDMVDELRLAGVPPAVIAAMKARVERDAPRLETPQGPRAGLARLTVEIARSGLRTLRAPDYADEDVKARLRLPKETEARRVHDLAVFLACASAEHAPDLWRSKTPLGRDMNPLTLRHEMLAFVPGETPPGKAPRLPLPAILAADVEDGVSHDVVVGVAALIGDRWILLASAVYRTGNAARGPRRLTARFDAGPGPLEFKVALDAPKP